MADDDHRLIPLPAPPAPRATPMLSGIVAKLRWSVESEHWSAHITPAECQVLLRLLDKVPLGALDDGSHEPVNEGA